MGKKSGLFVKPSELLGRKLTDLADGAKRHERKSLPWNCDAFSFQPVESPVTSVHSRGFLFDVVTLLPYVQRYKVSTRALDDCEGRAGGRRRRRCVSDGEWVCRSLRRSGVFVCGGCVVYVIVNTPQ